MLIFNSVKYITVIQITINPQSLIWIDMKFYNREKELTNLQEIEIASKTSSKMTIIVGRRRIGKTKLIQEAYQNRVYLFVSKKMKLYFVKSLYLSFKLHLI